MIKRCYVESSTGYNNYGGRGIGVCERWRNSFEAFLADMGPRPDGCSINRIDNDGPYAPENCRWATDMEQRNNSRNNHVVQYLGQKFTFGELAERFGIHRNTLFQRLKLGWPLELAIRTPVSKKKLKTLLRSMEKA